MNLREQGTWAREQRLPVLGKAITSPGQGPGLLCFCRDASRPSSPLPDPRGIFLSLLPVRFHSPWLRDNPRESQISPCRFALPRRPLTRPCQAEAAEPVRTCSATARVGLLVNTRVRETGQRVLRRRRPTCIPRASFALPGAPYIRARAGGAARASTAHQPAATARGAFALPRGSLLRARAGRETHAWASRNGHRGRAQACRPSQPSRYPS